MRVVDDKKIAEWMEQNGRMRQSVETRGLEKSVRTDTFLLALLSGTFDPTPPVQPDTEELSQADIKELSDMFKSIESSCNSIAGHLEGMNNTLDRFGEVIPDDQR